MAEELMSGLKLRPAKNRQNESFPQSCKAMARAQGFGHRVASEGGGDEEIGEGTGGSDRSEGRGRRNAGACRGGWAGARREKGFDLRGSGEKRGASGGL